VRLGRVERGAAGRGELGDHVAHVGAPPHKSHLDGLAPSSGRNTTPDDGPRELTIRSRSSATAGPLGYDTSKLSRASCVSAHEMKRLVVVTLLVGLSAVVPGVDAARQSAQPGNLSIAAAPNPVKFGKSVTISGKLTGPKSADKTVQLREDPFPFDDFANVATVAANAQGDYTFTRTPAVNTRYQTRQGGNESEILTVTVRPAISLRVSDRTPAAGRRVRFSGQLCPEHDGGSLAIQRRGAQKRWRTVRRATLADLPGSTCSSFTRGVRVRRDGAYRASFAADADHADGSSRVRRIDVH
jgi:hypothetical protein